MLTTKHVLVVPEAALAAADHLRRALSALNQADSFYAVQEIGLPYGEVHEALLRLLSQMVGGTDFTDETFRIARSIMDDMINNGEGLLWQLTEVRGWEVHLTHGEGEEPTVMTPSNPQRRRDLPVNCDCC